jgi:hypothetical protein
VTLSRSALLEGTGGRPGGAVMPPTNHEQYLPLDLSEPQNSVPRVNELRPVRRNLALLGTFGALGFSAAGIVRAVSDLDTVQIVSPPSPLVHVAPAVACLALIVLAAWRLTTDRFLFRFALAVEVFCCLAISTFAPFVLHGVSDSGKVTLPALTWVVPIIFLFSSLVPASLKEIRLAAIASVSTVAIGVGIFLWMTTATATVAHWVAACGNAAFAGVLVLITTPLFHNGGERANLYGHYFVQKVVGSGGFGTVWAADHIYLPGKVAAIKLIPFDRVKPSIAGRSLRTFWSEAAKTAGLHSDSTVRVFDFGSTFSHLYMTMELLDGKTLDEIPPPAPVDEAVRILDDICVSLEEAHAQGFLHLDLKPTNVMILTNGAIKVLDFGIGAFYSLQSDSILPRGTIHYRSPEQIIRGQYSPASDVYSLGCLAFYLLTGVVLFDTREPDRDHLETEPVAPSVIVSAAASCDAWVLRCLRKQPAERFQSVTELRESLATTRQRASISPSTVAVSP